MQMMGFVCNVLTGKPAFKAPAATPRIAGDAKKSPGMTFEQAEAIMTAKREEARRKARASSPTTTAEALAQAGFKILGQ